jgi:copper transport protein
VGWFDIKYVRQPQTIFINMFILLSIIIVFAFPQYTSAHALLERATPAPDSHLQSTPKEIVLSFNERIEDEFYFIKVFNENGNLINDSNTVLSTNQKELSSDLPNLANGNYTVSYSVISADGHPIKGSYIFTFGEVENGIEPLQGVGNQDEKTVLTNVVRIIYYLALILVTGWMIWGFTSKTHEEIRNKHRKIALYIQLVFLIANIGMGYVQFAGLIDSLNRIGSLITGTTVGMTWMFSMLLSLSGFVLLLRNKWLDWLWVLLLLSSKSVNGHALAFDPVILTVLMDLIHLIAAAIWAGGLLYILILRKRHSEFGRGFLVSFSRMALLSIILLVLTGTVLTLTYLPDIHYLLYSNWGKWLLVKIGFVLLVIIIGSILRLNLKKKKDSNIGKLIKIDFTLMILISVIVGIFTYLSPIPENKPLVWSEEDNHIAFTANITPKVPGDNMYMVDASSSKEGVSIKRVELFLKNKDNPDVAPIQVPFAVYEQEKKVHYMIEGPYIPFAGNWTVEVRILDSDDNESVYRKDIIVY